MNIGKERVVWDAVTNGIELYPNTEYFSKHVKFSEGFKIGHNSLGKHVSKDDFAHCPRQKHDAKKTDKQLSKVLQNVPLRLTSNWFELISVDSFAQTLVHQEIPMVFTCGTNKENRDNQNQYTAMNMQGSKLKLTRRFPRLP